MSKILPASCVSGVVTVETKPVTSTILGKGLGSSSGVALLEEDQAYYVGSNAQDISDVIDKVNSILASIVTVLTSLDALDSGANAATIATIVTANGQLLALKGALR